VAKEAGVSRTTVSFVLNNTPGKSIAEATRQRVMEAASRLGYIPNEDAQRLARTRTRSVSLFVCHSQLVYSDAFITRVLEGMSQAANRARVRLVVHPVSLRATDYREIALVDRAEGIILINAHDEDASLRELAASEFPAVTMDFVGSLPVDQVYVDNLAASREMVSHLIGLGHRRIAMISHAPPIFLSASRRLAGYREALEDAGIPLEMELVRYANFSEQSGFDQMANLLNSHDDITAVFASNDVVAYGAMQAILQSGRQIPGDISLAGFDDDYMSRFLNPALTTMVLPASGHGAAAVEVLMARLNGTAPDEPVVRVLSTHLVARESTAAPGA